MKIENLLTTKKAQSIRLSLYKIVDYLFPESKPAILGKKRLISKYNPTSKYAAINGTIIKHIVSSI